MALVVKSPERRPAAVPTSCWSPVVPSAWKHLGTELEHANGISTRLIAADLSQRSSWDPVADETSSLDVGLLAACAGFGTSGLFLNTDSQTELNMLYLNCDAVLALTKIFAERLVKRRRGGIVLISSLLAFQGVQNAANYTATNAYVRSLAEGLHGELAHLRIDILASAPGAVESSFAGRANMAMGRAADAAVVAKETLDALGKTMTVLRGLLAKIMVGSLSTLPRAGRIAIMGRIMSGMTKRQSNDKA
jgi:uncharacterized protein